MASAVLAFLCRMLFSSQARICSLTGCLPDDHREPRLPYTAMFRKKPSSGTSSMQGQGTCPAPSSLRQRSVASVLAECCTAAARPELAQQLQQHYTDVGERAL